MRKILGIGIIFVTLMLFVNTAYAETYPFILRKGLGCSIMCEAIFVSQGSGKVYKIEYYDRIEAEEGTEVLIEFDSSDNFQTVINPRNGKRSNISKVERIK